MLLWLRLDFGPAFVSVSSSLCSWVSPPVNATAPTGCRPRPVPVAPTPVEAPAGTAWTAEVAAI